MLLGFGIVGYRSFFGDLQLVAPLKKVNLVAGPNNSGKSNILRFAADYLSGSSGKLKSPLDTPQFADFNGVSEIARPIRFDGSEITDLCNHMSMRGYGHMTNSVARFFEHEEFRLTNDELVWLRFPMTGRYANPSINQARSISQDGEYGSLARSLAEALTGGFSSDNAENASHILRFLSSKVSQAKPKVVTIEAFRQVRKLESLPLGHSGENLIAELDRLESPSAGADYVTDERKFEEINSFLKNVFEDDTARLRIPHDCETINVYKSGVTLPLDHYGTGVHQVVIMAAAATLQSDTLICIEEPEVHLHPLLQRKLIRYLSSHTTNQYLIATHSAHMLDYESAQIFKVAYGTSGSTVTMAKTPSDVSEICSDLGYRPSDLLQANSVIWVEGPSDRIYLQHWIAHEDPSLAEGLHFSIMFYGGRLLNHLTAHDVDVEQFISLRLLNRNISIIIDSDKTSQQKPINATKRRVKEEFESHTTGSAWITDGYTIENYVPVNLLSAAAKELYGISLPWAGEKWINPLGLPEKPRLDKIKIAQNVVANWSPDMYPTELRRRIRTIVEFIKRANDL